MKKIKTNKMISIYITLMFLIAIIILKFMYDSSTMDTDIWLRINSVTGLIMLIWSIISWKNLTKELISLYLVFLTLLYLFTYGQSLLVIFNLVDEKYDLLYRFSAYELINAQFFTLLSLISFHLGALFVLKKSNNNCLDLGIRTNRVENKVMIKTMKYVGVILLIVSFPGFVYETATTIKTVFQGGYGALYGYQTGGIMSRSLVVRIFSETSNYFIPSIICLLISFRENKIVSNTLKIIMVINVINALYVGGRSKALVLIISMILIHHYSVRNIKKSNAMKIGLLSYFLISFLSIVARLRSVTNKNISDYFLLFIDSFGKENLFIITISEIGWTMFPLGAVMRIVPSSHSYLYGKSYTYAITSIIPNIGLWEIHPAKVYSGGAQWLMDTLNLWSGPGFTLIADAFRNFGWYGFIVLIGFGMLFGKIYSSVDKYTIYKNPRILCVVMIFFVATVTSVRGDNLSIIRPLFFVVIPINFLIKVVYSRLLENND